MKLIATLVLAVLALPMEAEGAPQILKRGAQEQKKKSGKVRLLCFTAVAPGGWQHEASKREGDKLSTVEASVVSLGKESGLFETECSKDTAASFTPANLAKFDVIVAYTNGHFPKEMMTVLQDWLETGKVWIGSHGATDTLGISVSEEKRIFYAEPGGHPWGQGTPVVLTIHETDHPVTKMFGPEFALNEEIYDFSHFDRSKAHVLMSLTMAKVKPQLDHHVPVTWVRDYGKGRAYYTTLGHSPETWNNPQFRAHLLATIRWGLRLEKGGENTAPTPERWALEDLKALFAVAGEGDPVALAASIDKRAKSTPAWAAEMIPQAAEILKLSGADRQAALKKLAGTLSNGSGKTSRK